MDEDTDVLYEGIKLNEHINTYFSNIGIKLANECTPGDLLNDFLDEPNDPKQFNRTPFTVEEVKKVCNEINIHKSASVTNVKTSVLKDAFIDNMERITKMFNSSMSTSTFPGAWKLSTIVPLPKVPHPKTASDLRPVALTPLPGKLMEKLTCGRLQKWLVDNKILSSDQHGFRKNKSTVSAIASLLDSLHKNINDNRNSYIVYLDLKKAFDTIPHTRMIAKLQMLGMDETTLSWFKSYLSNRLQCVKLNNLISETLPITYGVPQGSILGPILFSIYINDIVKIVNCGIVLYADDTVIFHHDKNVLQSNLKSVSTWCNDNLLTVNVKKSHWMKTKVCGGVDIMDQGDISFKIRNKELSEVNLYKYLGLYIDNNLNFQAHHKKTISQVHLKLSQFRKIRSFINKKAAILIYKCTILPVIEYADFIHDQGIMYINKAIQKLQNHGLLIAHNQHILPYDRRDSSDTLHRNSRLSRLVHRRKLHLLQFAFKLKEDIALLDLRDIRTRRHVGVLFNIQKSNHYKYPKNPYYRCMIEWNNLSVELSLLKDKDSFTRAIKGTVRDPYVKVL